MLSVYKKVRDWFQGTVYRQFALRVLVAIGSAAIAVALSFLPYDTVLQAIWVVISSMFMGYLVLRQRLNESDQQRYERLFNSRFAYLQENDPEALTTIFAENLRPPVLNWFHSEYKVPIANAQSVDALDSLARNGDKPGQLIFRTGVELGQWLQACDPDADKLKQLENRLQQFVTNNEHLLGNEVAPGMYIRHIHHGEQRPVGVHMFHPLSRLLLAIEYYDADTPRHAVALSARAHLFVGQNSIDWKLFKDKVWELFPGFMPANGGSGPQTFSVPFFIGPIMDTPVDSDSVLTKKLLSLNELFPQPDENKDVPSVD